jgi:hypothetical protein
MSTNNETYIGKSVFQKTINIVVFTIIAFALSFLYQYCTFNYSPAVSQQSDTLSAVNSQSTLEKGWIAKPIEKIGIFDRVSGTNPEISNEERATFLKPDPQTWRILTLEIDKDDGNKVFVKIARPISWIESSGAIEGQFFYFSLPEFGIDGNAFVHSIDNCPLIRDGLGSLVTGTFKSTGATTFLINVAGIDKPIECTGSHPFWSVDSNTFIATSNLKPGDRLQLRNDQTAQVLSVLPQNQKKIVYNIEVLGEHVYEVTTSGILTHNACLNATVLRNSPGKAIGGEDLPKIGSHWFETTKEGLMAGEIPQQVATKLRGQTFKNFDDFRIKFWKAVSEVPEIANEFSSSNQQRMSMGHAPHVPEGAESASHKTYILHHINPIHNGGGVYDLGNLVVVSPKYHDVILPSNFHYGH